MMPTQYPLQISSSDKSIILSALPLLRAAKWSLQELEIKYNASVEKTAILEGEVASKVALSEEVQRLKDELRGNCHCYCSCCHQICPRMERTFV